MDNKNYNKQRYNRKKQMCRLRLGAQQLLNYPILNFIWLLFVVGVVLFIKVIKIYVANMDIYPMFEPVFITCVTTIIVIFPIICALGFVQLLGFVFAIRDEANMEIVFGHVRDIKNQSPILIYKKKDRESQVTKREFYSIIPMEKWQEARENICDVFDICLIGQITYGGRKKNRGNQICFESSKGRKPKERGVLYDDVF